MSLTRRSTALALWLVSLFAIRPVPAQPMGMRFDIPFRFYLGDKALPAGTYTVELDRNAGYVELQNRREFARLSIYAKPAMRDAKDKALDGRLRFYVYGTTRVLKQVWMPGDLRGGLLQTSKTERELAKVGPARVVAQVAAE